MQIEVRRCEPSANPKPKSAFLLLATQKIMTNLGRTFACILICLIVLSLLHVPIAAQASEIVYEFVIRNGRVLDGAGNPWIRADVAIKNNRFVRIGRVEGKGKREIDARGKYVSPGWIDVMDQSGGVLPRNGLAENKLLMGVTTAIGGEGGTPVPAEKITDYFAGLEKSGISINFGTYFSETQARVAVLGEASAPHRALRPRAARAHARRGDPQNDLVARDPDAPRRTRTN